LFALFVSVQIREIRGRSRVFTVELNARDSLQPWKIMRCLIACFGLAAWAAHSCAAAEKKYDPGASDTEIKIGNIMPYSGAQSALSAIGKAEAAYFRMINDAGGINGRKINFVSMDGAYNPAKTVEVARRLVEQDQVLLIFGSVGTAPNVAIRKYLNTKKVPQLFGSSGARQMNDPAHYPWTMGFNLDYQTEAATYAQHILQHMPQAKIGVLYENNDFGKDYLRGLKDGH
jgi:branched-chain amino acid transport system substrate-binding protein